MMDKLSNTICMKTKSHATEIDKQLGERLRFLRNLRGYTQVQLAERLDMTFQQVQKYEKGTNRISAARLIEMSNILKCDIEDFTRPIRNREAEQIAIDPKLYGTWSRLPIQTQQHFLRLMEDFAG